MPAESRGIVDSWGCQEPGIDCEESDVVATNHVWRMQMKRSIFYSTILFALITVFVGCEDMNQGGASDSDAAESAEAAAEHAQEAASHARDAAEAAEQLVPEPADPKERAAMQAADAADDAAYAAEQAADDAADAAEKSGSSDNSR